ncbi:MAG TPA: lipocalin-like domain-containing protein [Terriglobales bacterium]|nr:lipocalin-like domain-containing protein [Terriglobales bacterium]
MKTRKHALIPLIFLAGSVLAAASDRDRFVGTWKLVSISDSRANYQKEWLQFGSHPKGYIMYDRTGHMCVQIIDPDRPKWKSAEPNTVPSADELNTAAAGYAAYCGRYDVNEKQKYVVHHVELELVPNSVGEDRRRGYRLYRDRLDLTPEPGRTLTWEKIK